MSAKNLTSKRATQEYGKQDRKKTEKGDLEEYLPLVKYIAGRLAIGLPRSVEMDDLINAGVVGLIEAYHNFDAEKGVKFETYASLRIRGSILDELRGMDWVPRSTRARSREIERTIGKLENELGRSPNEAELAQGLGVDISDYYTMMDDVSSTALLSLDELTYGRGRRQACAARGYAPDAGSGERPGPSGRSGDATSARRFPRRADKSRSDSWWPSTTTRA